MPSLRLLEVIVPADRSEDLDRFLEDEDPYGLWTESLSDERVRARMLVARDRTESVSDRLSARFGEAEGFRVLLFEVEATIPRIEEPAEEGSTEDGGASAEGGEEEEEQPEPARVSREELYSELHEGSELSRVYLVTVALSTLVAAIGLVRGDTAVVIGAMVIAPLLGPNVALALAATLGDGALASRALKTIAAGVVTAGGISLVMGTILPVDPTVAEIADRTDAKLSDMALALAAGSAGSLAFTTGIPTALIGVMVAVALLPPLATAGLLVGAGQASQAGGALLLVLTNVACINLAGIATFLVQRVRPRTWWEEEQAKRATRVAVGFWLAVLGLLAGVIALITWFR